MACELSRHSLSLVEDSQLELPNIPISSTYCPSQNCLVSLLRDGTLSALDVSSGALLHRTQPIAGVPVSQHSWFCNFLPSVDRLVVSDGKSIGFRRDLNGAFLLDSILQSAGSDDLLIEIPLSETPLLLWQLKNSTSSSNEKPYRAKIVSQLEEANLSHQDVRSWQKTSKWKMVVLHVTTSDMVEMLSDVFSTWPRNSSADPRALPLLSLLRDRLRRLVTPGSVDLSSIPDPSGPRGVASVMGSELHRLKTFRDWPQMSHKWALPSPMARAGFYYHPSAAGDDRVLCFSCGVCLAYWEPTDEPWSEHERHGGQQCRFIKGSATKNVVLASSLATAVASPVLPYHAASAAKADTVIHHHVSESVIVSSTALSVTINHLQLDVQTWASFTMDPFVRLLVAMMRDGFDEQFGAGDEEMYNSLLRRDLSFKTSSRSSPPLTELTSPDVSQTSSVGEQSESLLEQLLTKTNSSRAVINGLVNACTAVRKSRCGIEGAIGVRDVDIAIQQSVLLSATRQAGLGQPAQAVRTLCDSSRGAAPMWTVSQWPYHCELTAANVLVLATIGGAARDDDSPEEHRREPVLMLVTVTPPSAARLSGGGSSASADAVAAATEASLPMDDSMPGTKVMANLGGGMFSEDSMADLVGLDKDDLIGFDGQSLLPITPPEYLAPPTSVTTQTPMPPASPADGEDAAQSSAATSLVCFGAVFAESETGFAVQSLVPVGNGQAVVVATRPMAGAARSDDGACSCRAVAVAASDAADGRSSCVLLFSASVAPGGGGVVERRAAVYLGSSRCSVTSVCAVPKLFCRGGVGGGVGGGGGAASAAACTSLLACAMSCGGVLVVAVPSLAVLAAHTLPAGGMAAAGVADGSSDDAVPAAGPRDGSGVGPLGGDLAGELSDGEAAAAAAAVWCGVVAVAKDDTAAGDLNAADGDVARCATAATAAAAAATETGDIASACLRPGQPSVFYCAGLEQLCVINNSTATFIEAQATLEVGPDQATEIGSPVRAFGVTQLDDAVLRDLHLATVFEPCGDGPHSVRITAPSSWEEVSRQQLLRRQPQHLQQAVAAKPVVVHMGGGMVPPSQSSKSSMVGSNTSTASPGTASPQADTSNQSGLPWKTFCRVGNNCQTNGHPQIFEITMPRQCPLARVDVKFRLKDGDSSPSPILVTLLQDCSSKSSRSSEQMLAAPFLYTGGALQEFVAESGATVISGPVSVHSGLEGLGPNGQVSLSPPSLVDTSCARSMTFYVHFANMSGNGGGGGGGGGGDAAAAVMQGTLNIEELKVAVLQWPDESSPSSTALPLSAMRQQLLYDRDVWRGLVAQVLGTGFDDDDDDAAARSGGRSAAASAAALVRSQTLALDLLLWVAGMWSTHPASPLVAVVQERCEDLVMVCFVRGTRTIAHQCAQLFLFCIGCFAVQGSDRPCAVPTSFQEHLCSVMLRVTPLLLASAVRGASDDFLDGDDGDDVDDGADGVEYAGDASSRCTAGAVYWFFVGLCSLAGDMPAAAVTAAIKPLLATVLDVLESKRASCDPDDTAMRRAHDLLSRRLDLHDMPLEPMMYDASAATGPSLSKFGGVTNTPAGTGGGGNGSGLPATAGAGSSGAVYNVFDPPHPLPYIPDPGEFMGGSFPNAAGPSAHPGTHFIPFPGLASNFYGFGAGATPFSPSVGASSANISIGLAPGAVGGAAAAVAVAAAASGTASANTAGDDAPTLSSTTEKFLRAVLFSSSLSGGEAAPLRQSTFPPMTGLLEVLPLPFTIHRHSNGVRAGANAESHVSHFDGDDRRGGGGGPPPPAANHLGAAALDGVAGSFKRRSVHERLVSPVCQPHTFLFDHINSGERHTIVLDLGSGVHLTDLVVYPCPQFSSLAVHVWDANSSERSAKRLASCTDIATRSLVLNDVCPPLPCQFLKIVLIGALGGSHTHGQLVIGGLFGTLDLPAILSSSSPPHDAGNSDDMSAGSDACCVDVLSDAYADLECRYCAACQALEQLIDYHSPGRPSAMPAPHAQQQQQQSSLDLPAAYSQCCTLRLQMNRVRHMLASWHRRPSPKRLPTAPPAPTLEGEPLESLGALAAVLASSTVSVLQALAAHLVDALLAVCVHTQTLQLQQAQQADHVATTSESTSVLCAAFSPRLCKQVLEELCVYATWPAMLPLNSGALVLQTCSRHPWWSSLLKDLIAERFTANSYAPVSQQRLYLLICNFVNLSSPSVLPGITEKCVDLLYECLEPLSSAKDKGQRAGGHSGLVDSTLVAWLLLLLSHFLDLVHEEVNSSMDLPRFNWDFIVPASAAFNQAASRESKTARAKDTIQRRIRFYQAQLRSMGMTANASDPVVGSDGKLETGASDMSTSNSPSRPSTPCTAAAAVAAAANAAAAAATAAPPAEPVWRMEAKRCAEVLQRLMRLVEGASMSVSADTYILACKVISCLSRCSSPPVSISSLVDRSSLLAMLQLCLEAGRPAVGSLDLPVGTSGIAAGWSGPWAVHALSGMFLDMMMAERVWISQVYSQFYSVDDPLAAGSPRNVRANAPSEGGGRGGGAQSSAAGSSLVEASRHALDGVCNMLNKLVVPQTLSTSATNMKLSSQIASLKTKSQHLKAKLEAMKSSQHTSLFTGKLKEVDAKIDRLKNKVLEIQRLHKAHGLSTAPSGAQSSSSLSRSLKISAEHDSRLEMSAVNAAETALQSLVHCQHVSNLQMWRCPPPTPPGGGAADLLTPEQQQPPTTPDSSSSSAATADGGGQDPAGGRASKAGLDRVLRRSCSVQFMLCKAFDSLFQGMTHQSDAEGLLELWMQLNPTSGCAITFVGTGTLNLAPESVLHVLRVLAARRAQVTLRTWALLFHLLTSVCYLSPINRSQVKERKLNPHLDGWQALVTQASLQAELSTVLLAFLRQPTIDGGRNVGPWVVHIMETFLMLFVGVTPSGREGSPTCVVYDQQEPASLVFNFRPAAYSLLLNILLELLHSNSLGQGGAVDAQAAFVNFLVANSKFVPRVDRVILRIWRATCLLAQNIGPTLNSTVFCSGGLSAKLEEKGKPVPLPQHQGYLAAVEPILCSLVWLVLSCAALPIAPAATDNGGPPAAASAVDEQRSKQDSARSSPTIAVPAEAAVATAVAAGDPPMPAGTSERPAAVPAAATACADDDSGADTSDVAVSTTGTGNDSASDTDADPGTTTTTATTTVNDSTAYRRVDSTTSDTPTTDYFNDEDEDSADAAQRSRAGARAGAGDAGGAATATATAETSGSDTPSSSATETESSEPGTAASPDPDLVAQHFLADTAGLRDLLTCLNLCPWWQRPSGLPSMSALFAAQFEDVGRFLYVHCQKNALDLAKQSHLFPSALMAVFVTLLQHSALAAEVGRHQDTEHFVLAVLSFLTGEGLNAPTRDGGTRASLGDSTCQTHMSEPVLLLVLSVLSSPRNALDFIENDGLGALADSLICSGLTQWDFRASGVSHALRTLGSLSTFSTSKRTVGREQESRASLQDKEDTLVLKNFAPYGQITANPRVEGGADSLDALLAPTAPYRRARAANWSYRFSSSSPKWVSLTIQLPLPIVLKVLQVTAHGLSLANAPSCIVVDAAKAPGGMLPVGCSTASSGCGCVRMELLEPRIVTSVCIRLKRPVDSDSISLTHIGIYGTAAFSCSLSFTGSSPLVIGKTNSLIRSLPLTHVSSSLTWLHCLVICLQAYTNAADAPDKLGLLPAKFSRVAQAVTDFTQIMAHLRVLLQIFQNPLCSDSHCLVEEILTNMAGLSETFSVNLTRALLACAAPVPAAPQRESHPSSASGLWSSAACGSFVSEEAALHLIYSVGSRQDQYLGVRASILLEWLCCLSSMNISSEQLALVSSCLALRIQAVAACLYQLADSAVPFDASLLTEEAFRLFLPFTAKAVACDKSLGLAMRNALGCLSRLRPAYFAALLADVSAGLPTAEAISSASLASAQCVCAMACADPCTHLLLDSDFLDKVAALITALVANHAKSPAKLSVAAALLELLAALCEQCAVQDALRGSRAAFWRPLLGLLCGRASHDHHRGSRLSSRLTSAAAARQRKRLQGASLAFFAAVTHASARNAEAFVDLLCGILREERVRPDAGFMRRVLMDLLLRSERVRIVLRPLPVAAATAALSKAPLFSADAQQQLGNHLRWPVGRGVLVRDVSVCCSLTQLSETVLASKAPAATAAAKSAAAAPGTATPTTAASESQSAASAASWKTFLKKYNGEELPFIDEGDMLDFDVKWSNVVKAERQSSTEEAPATGFVAALSFRASPHEHSAEATATVADVLRPAGCPEGGGGRCVQLYYALAGHGGGERKSDLAASAADAPAWSAAGAGAGGGKRRPAGEREEQPWQAFTLLQLFAKRNGLRILADHIPSWYSSIGDVAAATGASSSDATAASSSGLVQQLPDYVPILPPFDCSVWPLSASRLPSHTLAALALLLRLPLYAECLLEHKAQAATLLRLLFGVPCEGALTLGAAGPLCSLPTLSLLPFALLVSILHCETTASRAGFNLRVEALNGGLLHFLLASLAHLSHADKTNGNGNGGAPFAVAVGSDKDTSSTEEVTEPAGPPSGPKAGLDGKLYWAKGTGFGTGSTHSTWDVNQAVTRQKKEESHVTAVLEILAGLFDCNGVEENEDVYRLFAHPWLLSLLRTSCLLPLLWSYLCNDSVLDMSCHLVVNSAVLLLVRAISTCEPLCQLLLESVPGNDSILSWLTKMKNCLDTYTLCLGKQKPGKVYSKQKQSELSARASSALGEATSEGIAALVQDVNKTHQIVSEAIKRQRTTSEGSGEENSVAASTSAPSSSDDNDYYVSQIKLLQFGAHTMVEDDAEGVPHCVVEFGYKSLLYEAVSGIQAATRAQRLAQEMSTLSTSLPVSSGSSVFVRCDEERLDVMKVLITGPEDTPYFGGCFEFDVFFPADYPQKPMKVNLATTGNQTVRFNPNLYNDGKVCLSVLNTWHGRPEEKWNPQTSSLLQVLVSIQSLILVPEPYFNEPGYERSRNTALGDQASLEYNANIKQATMKWAMLEQLRKTPAAFKDVIRRHFFLKQKEILDECVLWIGEATQRKQRMHSYSSAHVESARRHLALLRTEFAKLKDEPITDALS